MSESEKMFFASLIGGLVACVLLIGLYVWKAPHPVRVAKLDLAALLKEEAHRLSERKLSLVEEKAALDQVMSRLRKTLATQDPNTVVLDASVILSHHVPDITGAIRQQLRAKDSLEQEGK